MVPSGIGTAIATALVLLTACSSTPGETSPTLSTEPSSSESADSSSSETTSDVDPDEPDVQAPLAAETGRTACAGLYTGTYDGDDSGPFVLRIDETGELQNAFVTQELLGTDAVDIAELALDLDGLDLKLGVDVIVTGSLVEIMPSALRAGPDGPQLGTVPIELDRIGTIDEDGQVTATAQGGAQVRGVFDWITCTGTGSWANDDLTGEWQVGLNPSSLGVEPSDCLDGRYVGTELDQDDVVVDLDAVCVSASLADSGAESIGSGISIAETEGFTGYTLTGAVLFEFGSTQPSDSAIQALEAVAESILEEHGPQASVLIIGHTDAIGSDEANLALSERRGESVLVALTTLLPDSEFDVEGLGEFLPVAPNAKPDGTDDPDGRLQNRRVEIVVATEE